MFYEQQKIGRTQFLGFLSSEVVGPLLKKMNVWDICWQVNEFFLQKKKKKIIIIIIYEVANMLEISLTLVLFKDNLNMVWTATKYMPMWAQEESSEHVPGSS